MFLYVIQAAYITGRHFIKLGLQVTYFGPTNHITVLLNIIISCFH